MTPTTQTPERNLAANSRSTAAGAAPQKPDGKRPMFYEFKPKETIKAAHGTPEKAERLKRVLTTDPGLDIFRYADAGYELAQDVARERGAKIPGLS